jgi:Tfp pilus assembly protein PilO
MKRGVIFGAIIAAAVITALWWFFVIGPRNEEVADVNQQLDAAEAREESLRTQIRQLTAIKDQEVSYLFAIGQMETAIPENPEEAAFIDQINFLADRTGVDLQNLTLAPPSTPIEEGAEGYEIPTRIVVEGGYFEVLGFLYGVEALERLVRVDSLLLAPQAQAGQEEDTAPPEEDAVDVDVDVDVDPTEEPRPRPQQTILTVNISAVLFTRTQVQVDPDQLAGLIGEDGSEEEGNGDGSSGETTTTTTPETTTTTPETTTTTPETTTTTTADNTTTTTSAGGDE